MADHVSTVCGIYQAFGTGDVAWILDQLADDVAWDQASATPVCRGWSPGTGKDHVLSFFQALGAGVAFDVFVPGPICEGGDTVIAAVREAGTVLATGRRIEEDIVRAHLDVRRRRQGHELPPRRRLRPPRARRSTDRSSSRQFALPTREVSAS